MKTLTGQAEIGPDGKLRIEVPCDMPPGRAEAVIVVSEVAAPGNPPYDTLEGALVGLASPDYDVDGALREMNDAWKSKLGKG